MKLAFATAAAALAFASPASAAIFSYTLTGSYTASWQLDTDNISIHPQGDQAFTITDVSGTFPGSHGDVYLYFYAGEAPDGGGLGIADPGYSILADTVGPQLFTGSTSAPTFKTGLFQLAQYGGPGTYTLLVQEVAGAVPEPATWAMMIAGFGFTGAALRRRRPQPALAAKA